MSKEYEKEVSVARVQNWRERFSNYLQDIMAGDSYVLFPDGGVMPVREYKAQDAPIEVILIDDNS